MILRLLALVGLGITLVTLSAPVAMAQSAARIVVEPPLAEPLSRGVVFINYRAEHVVLVPVFGAKAVEISPPIGHLHVALDGAPWGWGNTSGEPLIIFGLPAGPHKLQITLVNPNHEPLHQSVVEFVIPARDAATKSH
jgi:hypothetical protein